MAKLIEKTILDRNLPKKVRGTVLDQSIPNCPFPKNVRAVLRGTGRVQASTLLEVLIAMVIIMVVFTIALKIFNNVMASGTSFQKVKAQHQLGLLIAEACQQGRAEDQTVMIDSVLYSYSVVPDTTEPLMQLEIKATQQGKLLGSARCLIKQKAP